MAKTVDPNDVQIICGGNIASGYADGTFISISNDEELYSKSVGADGEVSRARMNNTSGTVTLTLQQTSPFNAVLSAFYAADKAGNNGVFPFMMKEAGTGTTLIFSQSAWVQDLPDVNYSKSVETREWTIALGKTDWFIGGNN